MEKTQHYRQLAVAAIEALDIALLMARADLPEHKARLLALHERMQETLRNLDAE